MNVSTPASPDPHPTSVAPRSTSAATPFEDLAKPDATANSPRGLSPLQVETSEVQGAMDKGAMDADADDPEDYFGCLILEEQPSPVTSS